MQWEENWMQWRRFAAVTQREWVPHFEMVVSFLLRWYTDSYGLEPCGIFSTRDVCETPGVGGAHHNGNGMKRWQAVPESALEDAEDGLDWAGGRGRRRSAVS